MPRQTSPLPKYTSSAVISAAKNHLSAYTDYATAYESLDRTRLAKVVDKHSANYLKDQNIGLIQLCQNALTKRVVMWLTKTYCSVSLGEVLDVVGRWEGGEELEMLGFVKGIIVQMVRRLVLPSVILLPPLHRPGGNKLSQSSKNRSPPKKSTPPSPLPPSPLPPFLPSPPPPSLPPPFRQVKR